jgi:hypothetical protein
LKPPHHPPAAQPRAVACDVAAHAWVRVPLESLQELRRIPGPGCDAPLPVSALKQADEQTVAAISAVYHAVHRFGLNVASFRDWGVLAAPYYMGRPALAAAMQRYQIEGAWGASPHLTAHRSLHSPSGTISQIFKIHGPNFGVCGGPGCATEVLAAAAAMIDAKRVPAVWVVLTALDPDTAPDRSGVHALGTHCAALALALTPPRLSNASGIRLRITASGAYPTPLPTGDLAPSLDLFGLNAVLDALTQGRQTSRAAFILPMEAGGRVEVDLQFGHGDFAVESGEAVSSGIISVPSNITTVTARPSKRLLSPLPLAEANR